MSLELLELNQSLEQRERKDYDIAPSSTLSRLDYRNSR